MKNLIPVKEAGLVKGFQCAAIEQVGSVEPVDREVEMFNVDAVSVLKASVLSLATIKAEVEAFDRGDCNAFDAMDAICVVVEAYRVTAVQRDEQDNVSRKEAA